MVPRTVALVVLATVQVWMGGAAVAGPSERQVHAKQPEVPRPAVGPRVIVQCAPGSYSGVPGHCLTGNGARTPPELRDVRAFGEREVLPGSSPLGHPGFGLVVVNARRAK